MLLAWPTAWLLLHGEYGWTLMVFFFAAVTDALDGYLAKRFRWTSELGKVLDPLADKILLVTVFITLAVLMRVPIWLAGLAVLRDVVIAAGAIGFRCLFGPIRGSPTLISKFNTLVQISYVLAVVSTAYFVRLAELLHAAAIVALLGWLTAATTLCSGVDYVLTYSKSAAAVSRQRRRVSS